jgi:excisionase family DNA binding protein
LTAYNQPATVFMMRSFINASKVAKLLNVDRATITRWIKQGKIQGAIQSPTGRKDWQIPLIAYQELMQHKKL